MTGCKPLSDAEVAKVLENLSSIRDKTLFILGVRTGFRISELLSLTVSDVTQYGQVGDTITVSRRNMKGKHASRRVPLHPQAKEMLTQYLATFPHTGKTRLFPFTRQHAHRILKRAVLSAHIAGKVSTHSMRKTFADRVHTALGENIFKTQQAMGHASVSSTASYLSFKEEEITAAIVGTK